MSSETRQRARLRALATVAVLAVATAVLTVWPPVVEPARADTTILVNSTVVGGGADVNPGDGVCTDTAGQTRCTLRAALTEANAVSSAGNPTLVTVAQGTSGALAFTSCVTSQWMVPSGVPTSGGAYFAITAAGITLDLQNAVGVTTAADCAAAALYVTGANAVVQNVSALYSSGASIQVGAAAGTTLQNLTLQNTANNYPDMAVLITGTSSNVTVRNSVFSGFTTGSSAADATVLVGTGASVSGLQIVNATFTHNTSSTTCTTASGVGCRRSGIATGTGVTISDLVVRGNTFSNYTNSARPPIFFGANAPTLTNVAITGNRFLAITGVTTNTTPGAITLPTNKTLSGTNTISGNQFSAAAPSVNAVYWDGAATTPATSNLAITQNSFLNYGTANGPAVGLVEVGSLPIERNTFNPTGTTAPSSTTTETNTAASLLFNGSNANSQSLPWFPTVGSTPSVNSSACTVTLSLSVSTAANPPLANARQDVYWAASNTAGAEVYLGSATTATTSPASITVPYTVGTAGVLRIQSQGAARSPGTVMQSTAYSRVAAVAASSCRPTVTVEQAVGQEASTSARTIRFTATFSTELATAGAGQLSASDFSTSGSTATGVVVTGVTAIGPAVYEVTATAADSGTVVLSLPAGAVADVGSGQLSLASTSSDNSVTYVNPLTRTPDALAVFQGASTGGTYTISRAVSAVPPSSAATVAVTASNAFVTASPTPLSFTGSGATSATVTVTANDLAGATQTTTLTHAVTSTDANYNGLVVSPVAVTARPAFTLSPASGPGAGGQTATFQLNYQPAAVASITFGGTSATAVSTNGSTVTATTPARTMTNDQNAVVSVRVTFAGGAYAEFAAAYTYLPTPALTVAKTAFSDSARTSQLASGGGITAGIRVYWTYAVKNTGQATLPNVTVTDPQLPPASYPSGAVCTIPSLAPGATATCTADAVVGG